MNYLVIDVGGTYTKYAVMDENSNFYEKKKAPTVKDSMDGFVDMLVALYREYQDTVCGIALSLPGQIDSSSGFLYNAGSIFCLKNVNLVQILQNRCGVAVTVENDAKCAALAEVWKGVLADCQNAIALIIGTAVGGAIVCGRKILRGKNFMAGEFSYIFTDTKDCMNPKKLLAQTGGVPCLIRMVSEKKGIPETELDGEKIFSMANRGDEQALDCLRTFCRGLAVQISNYQFVMDPERVAIGGASVPSPFSYRWLSKSWKRSMPYFHTACPSRM